MSGANAWTLVGPDCVLDGEMHEASTPDGQPISGRVTALALAGATIFAGTAGGGLWSSSDAGVTWRPLTDALPCASIGALAFDAASNALWIGGGEGNSAGRAMFGQGLFRLDVSTLANPSPTFTRFTNQRPLSPDFFRSLRTTHLLLEPNGANPAIVWWGTTDGLFRSDDGGANWSEAVFFGVSSPSVSSMCLCQTAGGGDRLLVALWDTGLFELTASPAQFTAFTTNPGALPVPPLGGRIGLATAPSNPQRVYCVVGRHRPSDAFVGLFRSDRGGENWVQVSWPIPTWPQRKLAQSSYNMVLAVHPTKPNEVMFGETALWRSKDAGASWSDLTSAPPGTHSDQHAVVYDPADPQRVWFGNDGGVWLSTNGGDTLASRNRGLATLQYYAFAHHPRAASVLLAGAQDSGTHLYAGHPGWNEVGHGDGFFCAIDQNDPIHWYSSYVYLDEGKIDAIKRSNDAGASWKTIVDGIDPSEYKGGSEPFYCPFVVDPHSAGTLYLGTTRLWRSTDRGESWLAVRDSAGVFSTARGTTPSSSNSISNLCVDPNDANVICFATADGRLYRAHIDHVASNRQATATFVQARTTGAAPSPALLYVADVAIPKLAAGASSPAPVYMVLGSDYHAFLGTVLYSPPAGRVWKYDFTPGAAPDWTALGSTQLDVAFPAGPDLPHYHNFSNALAFDPANPQRLFLGCHVGVFESTDGGKNWSRFSVGLPNSPVVDLQFHPTRRLLRAATMGRSIWECPVDPLPAPNTTADIYIRDNVLDVGRFSTNVDEGNPLNAAHSAAWFDAVDMKTDVDALISGFDTPSSTIDYQSNGPIDYIGYQRLSQHALQRDLSSRVYLQVLNRGPEAAVNVRARVYCTLELEGGGFAALPTQFWTAFPDGALPAASAYTPIAASQSVVTLAPRQPHVFRFDFTAPDSERNVGLLAVITSDNDPITATGTDVQAAVLASKHLALKRVDLNSTTGHKVLAVLVALGVAAVVTATLIGAS